MNTLESTPIGTTCTKDMFLCHNGSCLNKARICDFTADCPEGEDEEIYCGRFACFISFSFRTTITNICSIQFKMKSQQVRNVILKVDGVVGGTLIPCL